MKPFTIELKRGNRRDPLYIQLYEYIRSEIVSGNLPKGTKLPALRRIAKEQNLSITTVEQAYNQLAVEGYVDSKPQSGFYVAEIPGPAMLDTQGAIGGGSDTSHCDGDILSFAKDISSKKLSDYTTLDSEYIADNAAFDFKKWRKVMMRVFDQHTDLLMQEGDPQGEPALRYEISKYVFNSRGVKCHPDQIVIGAGTQQLTAHIGRLLRLLGIHLVCTEEPGYLPVNTIFQDQGYILNKIPVSSQGISIEALPDSKSAVYVCPNNQFPTGAVMPIGNRYSILEWAKRTESLIIEDDYDSELRYFGRPISSLQGLEIGEEKSHVLYLGSFSATLFPSVKISYMVLPRQIMKFMDTLLGGYTQTCSKTEQLALAYFMEEGHYYTNIKKLRNLCGRKLTKCLKVVDSFPMDKVSADRTESGLNMILRVSTEKTHGEMSEIAKEMGIMVVASEDIPEKKDKKAVIFYYSRLPEDSIEVLTKHMIEAWLD